MSELQPIFSPRLRLAALLAIGAGVASLAMTVLGMAISGRWGMLQDLRILAVWAPRVLVEPAAYVALGVLVAKRRYWAMLALLVVGSGGLARQVLWIPLMARGLQPLYLLASVAIPATVLAAGLVARGPVSLYPDPAAVVRARRRSGVGLAVAAVLLLVLAGGLILLVWYSLGGNWSRNDRQIMMVAAGITALLGVAAVSFYRSSRSIRRGEQPGLVTLVWVFLVCSAALFVVNQMPYGLFSFDLRWIAVTVPLAANAAAVWLAVDLLHSRRRTEDPQSYGFAPIFAQPVLPVRPSDQGDDHASSSQG